jgi:hypothetical protein
MHVAKTLSSHIAQALGAASGSAKLSYAINIVNYPVDAQSAHELEHAVRSLIPADQSMHAMAEAVTQV